MRVRKYSKQLNDIIMIDYKEGIINTRVITPIKWQSVRIKIWTDKFSEEFVFNLLNNKFRNWILFHL